VRAGTWLATEHPEWILPGPGDGLLDLGNPAAWQWLVSHVDGLISEFGIDIYRQDFNMDPLEYWRAHDARDRQGMTEMRHVEGLLAYWDELLRRHPKVLYDNCASGGRRNDLESMRRGVPYTKSDYADDPVGVQGETYGIAQWIPYFAATWGTSTDPYLTRSRFAHTVGACLDSRVAGQFKDLPKRLEEWRKVAACYWGDFWPLTPYSLDSAAWIAWQFDVPEDGKGVVQAFRRAECAQEAIRVKLRGLEAGARYKVEDVDAAGARVMTGKELIEEGLELPAGKKPWAVIVTYEKTRA
jgi:alpha-galactosidase